MAKTTREEVRRAVHDLSVALGEAVEQVPADEVSFLGDFVRQVAGTVVALESLWRASGIALDPEKRSDLLVLTRLMKYLLTPEGISRDSTQQLEIDTGGAASGTERQIAAPTTRRGTPTESLVMEANEQWEAALARGRSHRAAAVAQLGPVLTPAETARRLGVSAVTVKNWRQQSKLLGIKFDDHQYVYPLFQFAEAPAEGENGVVRHFPDILRALPYASAWAKAQFFIAPLPSLGGKAPIEILRRASLLEGRNESNHAADQIDYLRRVAEHAGEMGA